MRTSMGRKNATEDTLLDVGTSPITRNSGQQLEDVALPEERPSVAQARPSCAVSTIGPGAVAGCARRGSEGSCELSHGYVARRGNSWQAAYRDPGGRERTRTFRRKVDAEDFGPDAGRRHERTMDRPSVSPGHLQGICGAVAGGAGPRSRDRDFDRATSAPARLPRPR